MIGDPVRTALVERLLSEWGIFPMEVFRIVLVEDSMWVWLYPTYGDDERIVDDSGELVYELLWLKPAWSDPVRRRAFGTWSDDLDRLRS